MSWETEEKKEELKEEPKDVEAKEPEKVVEKEEPKEEAKPEATQPETEPAKEPEEKAEAKMVPEALIGRVAKSIREKGRSELNVVNDRVAALEDENRRLREQSSETQELSDEPIDSEIIEKKVNEAFLKRQDTYGRQKYGQQYEDALLLVQAQGNPLLVQRIQGAANPADTLIAEAGRIAEEIQHASDPGWKERAIEEKVRKKLEAEMAEKIKARGNQPTDVQNVRAAGGEVRPARKSQTWDNLPG